MTVENRTRLTVSLAIWPRPRSTRPGRFFCPQSQTAAERRSRIHKTTPRCPIPLPCRRRQPKCTPDCTKLIFCAIRKGNPNQTPLVSHDTCMQYMPTATSFFLSTPAVPLLAAPLSSLPERPVAFQPPQPSQAATNGSPSEFKDCGIFQSACPSRGCARSPSLSCHFNPRGPHGPRPPDRGIVRQTSQISTHAALAGRDVILHYFWMVFL